MLRIYHSNRLDVLEEIIAFIIGQQPLADAFAPEVILVQSNGMAQWLQMTLAEKFTIAANMHFPLPVNFIWQMFTQVLQDVPEESAFTRPNMHWKLMTLLPQMMGDEAFTPLRHYLRDDPDNRKLFQLCWRLADLYDQYLVYRPHWLTSWQAGKLIKGLGASQIWQAPLWREITEHTARLGLSKWHKANLYQRFISRLERNDPIPGLPGRIFICGIPALPPVYLQALQALGHHCDVHLMVTNPCRYYWGDIRDATALSRLMNRQRRQFRQSDNPSFCNPLAKLSPSAAQNLPETGNPLLASWGKQGRDYIYLLSELTHFEEIDAFADIPAHSLLHNLQADLLELRNPAEVAGSAVNNNSSHKQRLDPDDRSLTLHVCHSPQREMEVLHDQLLAMLESDPRLTPRDIIVMVPDIDNYYPFIQAVFGAATGKRYIPYVISDRRTRQIHPILQAVISLLSLPESRFTVEDVLQLLEVPALASRFAIDETGLGYLRQWIHESGIRWGIDDDNVQEQELPATGQHTWRFGLTRMLLGYAMNSESGQWQGILPYDESSGLIAVLAGQLAELLEQLNLWRKTLAQPRYARDWLTVCRELIDCFFVTDQQSSEILALPEQQWQEMIAPMLSAQYPHQLPLILLRDELEQRLEQERFSQRFLAGPVNFCTLMPMRSIPFNIICIAGMNDGVYPRPLQPSGFDLLRQHPVPGDRSRRDDDRYLFLEALISARQTLYISYIGRSIQDNHPCFPSVLVEELMDYIGQTHCLPGDESLNSDDSGARVRRHITYQHTRTAFDAENFDPQSSQQSYAAQWLPAASGQGQAHAAFIQPLAEVINQQLDIETLQRFWQHPVRSFFQQRLKVSLHHDSDEVENDEPFALDNLQRYQLRQQILNAMVEQQDIRQLYQRYRSSGQLPYAAFGDLLWQQQVDLMQPLADKIRQQRTPAHGLEIDQTINGVRITGWINGIQDNGLLRWQPLILDARHGMSLWLEHLLCCTSGNPVSSRIYGTENSQWRFLPLDSETARQLLIPLLQGYQQGINQPLIFLPRSAFAWLNACYDREQQQINYDEAIQRTARNKLREAWSANYQHPGEGEDIWYQRIWRTLTAEYCQAIIDNAQRYLLPLWRYNQWEQE